MKKVLIIKNSFREQKSIEYKIKRFQEEFRKRGIETVIRKSIEIPLYFENSSPCWNEASDYAFCIYLEKDEDFSSLVEKMMPVVNSSESLRKCNNKFVTYLSLTGSGIPMPLTIPSRLCYAEKDYSEEKAREEIDFIESKLTYPLIAKNDYGSLGLQVYLIHNREELLKKYSDLKLVPHLYQEFVSTSYGKDYRIFTIGGKTVAAMERKNDHDFRSNIALGGKGFKADPPEEYLAIAEKASEILGLDYAGVDVLIGKDNKPLLSEVNSNAFFTEIEAISGVNITGLLVSYLLEKYASRFN